MSGWAVPGYTTVKSLGTGGFGAVVLARHDATGTPVAIKYLHASMSVEPAHAELFKAEAVTLGSLSDPHVVRLYEYVESPDGAAIVMELVDGVTLRDLVGRLGKTTPEAALVVLYGSLLGLAAAHAHGVVHRDYKPANVLVNSYGASKLTDFGIAARAGAATVPAGSLAYAPPEQFDGDPAVAASDVYAATATFYECLTGEPPFGTEASQSQTELIEKHRSAPIPMGPVPVLLQPLVARGLAKDASFRPADAAALAAELRTTAAAAYGEDWEERGRSHLGEAALLLAALWPTGGTPAVSGFTQEQVHLARGGQAQGTARPSPSSGARSRRPTRAQQHQRHVWHLEHLEHLRSLAQQGGGTAPASPPGGSAAPAPGGASAPKQASKLASRLRAGSLVVAVAAVVAAAATIAATGNTGTPAGPSGLAGSSSHPAVAAYQIPLETIPLAASTGLPPVGGNVYVEYHNASHSTATVSGHVPDATSGEVAELFQQQFPFTSGYAPVSSVTLNPAAGASAYSFQVSPVLATHYQVKLFRSAGATAPVAASAVTTVYVIADATWNITHCDTRPSCHGQYVATVYVPPAAMQAEMSKQWYVYLGADLVPAGSTPGVPAWLLLSNGNANPNGTASVTPSRSTGANSYTATINDSYNWGSHPGGTLYWDSCVKDTEAADGFGLPGSHGCGDQRISEQADYIGPILQPSS